MSPSTRWFTGLIAVMAISLSAFGVWWGGLVIVGVVVLAFSIAPLLVDPDDYRTPPEEDE